MMGMDRVQGLQVEGWRLENRLKLICPRRKDGRRRQQGSQRKAKGEDKDRSRKI